MDLRRTKVKNGKRPFSNNDVIFPFSNKRCCIEQKTELVPGLTLYLSSKDSELNYMCILNESVQKCKQIIEYIEKDSRSTNEYVFDVFINHQFIACGKANTKKEAKHDSAYHAYDRLKDTQPIIYKDEINHDHITTIEKGQLVKAAYMNADKIDDNNMGNKLLRKMGWAGSGGVGKFEHGISDPVFVDAVEDRRGVGHQFENRSVKKATVEDTISQFLRDEQRNDMKFSSELSKEDRALVHRLCQKYHLKHKSFGRDEERYLIVSKSRQAII